jgi:hypothetical protein
VILLRDGLGGDLIHGRTLWLHAAAKKNPRVRFMDREALPHGDFEHVLRFRIGDGHLVRVCASKKTGLTYYALPCAPDAIFWWDVATPEEQMAAQPEYEWRVASEMALEAKELTVANLREEGFECFELPETGAIYARRLKV